MGIDLLAQPTVISPGDPAFPKRFSDLPVPPRALWVRGCVPGNDARLVAMVGSRAATGAAAARVFQIAAELATAGWGVISGGALGIDAAAHRGALAAKGKAAGRTFAVLGCGIDVVYPDRHVALFRDIVMAGGALLSEYGPGHAPRRGQFPVRNRLVAALAHVVIVGESRHASGALITARNALTMGRPLLAIPGSAGTDGLLGSGAAFPVESARDVVTALSGRAVAAPAAPSPFADLLAVLEDGALPADVIARRLSMSLPEVLGALSEAELSGAVVRAPGAKFEARFTSRFEASRGP